MIIKTAYQIGDRVYVRNFPYDTEGNIVEYGKIREISFYESQEGELTIGYELRNINGISISALNHEIFSSLRDANIAVIKYNQCKTSEGFVTPNKYSVEIPFEPGEGILYYSKDGLTLMFGRLLSYTITSNKSHDYCRLYNGEMVLASRVFSLKDEKLALNSVPIIKESINKIVSLRTHTIIWALIIYIVYLWMK